MAKKAAVKAKRRARTLGGHYKADDPSTPDVNEAFVSVGGVAAATNKKPKKNKDNVIPLVTLEGDRMYPEQAKKYWAKVKKSAS
mgnify:CR=1 FL=1|jgi:hypothetical protein|tara:strand:+ start:5160 stop:5411 length:252 start_codon:yes stop_codon:yes gene_type:complete